MKKLFATLFLITASLSSLAAVQHLSVPLGHRVYDVIAAAELRGLIEPLGSSRPYATDTVLQALYQLKQQSQRLNAAELEEIETLLQEFDKPRAQDAGTSSILQTGSYSSYSEDLDTGVTIGAHIESQLTHSLTEQDVYDSRNALRVYFQSDIKNFLSIYMDFGLLIDKLDNRVFLDTDFTIPGEGFYMDLLNGGNQMTSIPAYKFFEGLDMSPEMAMSFMDGAVQLRWASIKRDWGPGKNNLQLSGSARSFDGIEAHVVFADWLRFSFVTGSLGTFSLNDIEGAPFFSDYMGDRLDGDEKTTYGNFCSNFSAQRVELSLSDNLIFSIYESVVYQKRFELGYLNPFAVYMFQQNLLGDYDNMLAGIDLQWQVSDLFKVYGAAATTEMHEISPSEFFVHPRNIMGMQGGVNIVLPFGSFSTLTLQYTQLDPFFYSHYRSEGVFLYPSYRDGETAYLETAYVNKGENLGYPLNPNSDEVLLQADIGLGSGWTMFLTMKYQRRSCQYGYEISQSMDYEKEYELEQFSDYLFEKTLSVELGASKTLADFPLTIQASYRLEQTYSRDIEVQYEGDGQDTVFNSSVWEGPEYSHTVRVGFSLYR